MNVTKKTKMSDLINYRLKITTKDSRQLIGNLLSFDKHLNLVLSDTEEFRVAKKSSSTEEKRLLGLIILRGEQIISLTIESKPFTDNKARLGLIKKGNGISKPLKKNTALKNPIVTKKSVFVPPPGFKR